jgi:molecular chaperone GrpE
MGRERQGLEMIARPLGEVLSSEGVETMDPLGTRFDPHQHYARQIRAVAAERDGRVVEVLRKGYRHQRRLLRSADVVVGQGAGDPAASERPSDGLSGRTSFQTPAG